MTTPSSGLADVLISVLGRGVVLVLKLEGPPGDRHLAVGLGLAESADLLLMAIGAGHLSRSFDDPSYWDPNS